VKALVLAAHAAKKAEARAVHKVTMRAAEKIKAALDKAKATKKAFKAAKRAEFEADAKADPLAMRTSKLKARVAEKTARVAIARAKRVIKKATAETLLTKRTRHILAVKAAEKAKTSLIKLKTKVGRAKKVMKKAKLVLAILRVRKVEKAVQAQRHEAISAETTFLTLPLGHKRARRGFATWRRMEKQAEEAVRQVDVGSKASQQAFSESSTFAEDKKRLLELVETAETEDDPATREEKFFHLKRGIFREVPSILNDVVQEAHRFSENAGM